MTTLLELVVFPYPKYWYIACLAMFGEFFFRIPGESVKIFKAIIGVYYLSR
jgi:hypothetical protein